MKDFAPRKEPTQERSKKIVESVFEAALLELQNEAGALNVNRVAESAGVSIGSLYQYFPKKEALLSAVIEHFMRKRVDAILARIDSMKEKERAGKQTYSLEQAVGELVDEMIALKSTSNPLERQLLGWFVRVGSLKSFSALDQRMIDGITEAILFLAQVPNRVRKADAPLAGRIVMQSVRAVLLTTLLQDPDLMANPIFRTELVLLITQYLKP